MRVTIRIVACAVLWTVAGYATAAVNIDKVTVEAGRVTIQGNTEESHEVVVRIDRHEKPIESRSWGRGTVFEVVVEASDKISLGGGKTSHGFVVTVKHGASNTGGNTIYVALTEGNPVVGTFAIRCKADLVAKDGVLTFADVTLKDGKKLPVSFRLEPKTVLANPPANEPGQTERRAVAVPNIVPLKLGASIPLPVQSAGVTWRGNTYHLVCLGSIKFDLDKSDRLKADIQAGVTEFDNVDYDISAAVFDGVGQMLGSARAQCKVQRMWAGDVERTGRTITLDFGISSDYTRAAAFAVSVSNRKVLTPDDWQK